MARRPSRRTHKGDIKAAADRAEARTKGEEPKTTKVDIDPVIATAEEIKAKMGRPTKYKPEYALVAAALCRRGATDAELAEEFGVTTVTIWRWSCAHEDFSKALKIKKGHFDDRVERSIAQRAVGYSYNTERVFMYKGEIVRARVVEHVPPDVAAAKLWLMNRRPQEWREAVQRVEQGGPGDFDAMTDAELDQYIHEEAKQLMKAASPAKGKGSSTRH